MVKQYSQKDRKITEDLYQYFLQHGEDDGWGEKDKYGNFQELIKIENYSKHPLKGSSILDVGCGTGDFSAFLRGYEVKSYLGVDIVKLSIQLAKLKYPKEKFKTGDFLRLNFTEKFDFIFFSGTLAATLLSDNYSVMSSFITKMWKLSRHGVAFNCLIKRSPTDSDDLLFLYDLEHVLSICKNLTSEKKINYTLNRAGDNLEFLQAHFFLPY